MSKLEAVRAKVIEAVPEIVELHSGVHIYVPNHTTQKKHGGSYATYLGKQGCGIKVLWEDGKKGLFHESTVFDVIGRPITLADVLRAIEGLDGPELAVNNEGQFFVFLGAGNGERSDSWEGTTTAWNLALPLDEQEPEVIEFLHKILCA